MLKFENNYEKVLRNSKGCCIFVLSNNETENLKIRIMKNAQYKFKALLVEKTLDGKNKVIAQFNGKAKTMADFQETAIVKLSPKEGQEIKFYESVY